MSRQFSRLSVGVFIVTTFLSAFLLFQVQPLISKTILPWFGGTPSVWTTCMLFFQVLLFAGYAYAHLLSQRLSTRWQMRVHVAILLAAALVLPVIPDSGWRPNGDEEPTLRIVLLLAASVGLPFFILSSTGPLLQRWFSRTSGGRSPYRLYAISNAGSLIALVSYPFVFEPAFSVQTQAELWSLAFLGFVVCCSLCAVQLMRGEQHDSSPQQSGVSPSTAVAMAPPFGRKALWFALAMAASVMLLATTNQVCLDVAAVPFLWVLPLTLYLFSFILCFDSERWYSRNLFMLALGVSVGTVVVMMLKGAGGSIATQVLVYFGGLFFCCMVCHGELARLKPDPRHLTSFYLIIAAGGAAGGLFVGVLAPLLFPLYLEMHIGLLACCLLAVVSLLCDRAAAPVWIHSRPVWLMIALGLVGMSTALKVQASEELANSVSVARNFYGVLRVQEMHAGEPNMHQFRLMHGRIIHGMQFTAAEKHLEPTAYYGRNSGVGLLLETLHRQRGRPLRVGLVGLGVGTLAAYARPGDDYRFYEINRDVVRLARQHFTYLENCRGKVAIIIGDARLSLEHEPPQRFDVLVLDAFSGDAVPAHLLTEEAFRIYQRHLRPEGALAFHVSNLHFDLRPVLEGLADRFGWEAQSVLSEKDRSLGTQRCLWYLLSRDEEAPAGVRELPQTSHKLLPPPEQSILWTDDRSNLFEILQ